MPIPFALMGAGALLSVGSGLLAGAAARREARRIPTDPDFFDPGSGALDRLIGRQQGRNIGQESQLLARTQGFGFDQGQFEQSAAIRGAGRNVFGRLGEEARQQGQERFATAAEGLRGGLERERMGAVERLMSQRIGARQFAISTANQNRMVAVGLRGQAARNTFGPIGQMGGMMFGSGLSGALAPASPGATGIGQSTTSAPGSNQFSPINQQPLVPQNAFGPSSRNPFG